MSLDGYGSHDAILQVREAQVRAAGREKHMSRVIESYVVNSFMTSSIPVPQSPETIKLLIAKRIMAAVQIHPQPPHELSAAQQPLPGSRGEEQASERPPPALWTNYGDQIPPSMVDWLQPTSRDTPIEEMRANFEREGYVWLKNVIPRSDVYDCRETYFKCIAAGKMLAILSEHLTTSSDHSPAPITIECLSNLFLFHLNSKSSLQRMCVGLILQEWAMYKQSRGIGMEPQPKQALERCLSCLEENVPYDEISTSFSRLQQEVRDFVSLLNSNKIPISREKFKAGSIFTFEQINELLVVDYPNGCNADAKVSPAVREAMNERSRSLSKSLASTTTYQTSLITVTSSILASAVIAWNVIPSKLNPLI